MSIKIVFTESDMNLESSGYRTCTVTNINETGICTSKKILCSQLLTILNNSMEDSNNYLELGEMPRGYLDGKVSDLNPLSAKILLFIPQGVKSATYENTVFRVPMPNMLMRISIFKGRQTQTSIFCLKNDMTKQKVQDAIREKKKFPWYQYPFGNVGDDGSICWGNNTFKSLKKIKEVELFPIVFFDSPSNDDYYKQSRTNLDFKDVRMLYEYLIKKEKFPDEILVSGGEFNW